jgi:hypothetical protein
METHVVISSPAGSPNRDCYRVSWRVWYGFRRYYFYAFQAYSTEGMIYPYHQMNRPPFCSQARCLTIIRAHSFKVERHYEYPQKVDMTQESNREKQEVAATQQNPLEVEVIDLIRFREPEAKLVFTTAHIVPELYDIAKERRNVSLILIDDGIRYSLRNIQISQIETDGTGRMKCYYYVNESPPSPTAPRVD